MIFGSIEVKAKTGVLDTHNDSYILSNITTISARRPFLASGLMIGALISAFGISFFDLLTPAEVAVLITTTGLCVFLGLWLGQLQLLSRDLRGSELGTAIWGSYHHLNRIRRQVADAVNRAHRGNENKGDVV